MEHVTIGILLINIIQYVIVLSFCIYVLDLKWSKKQIRTIILFVFLPTKILFLFIGPLSILYFLTALAIMVYRETKVISHITHVFNALIFLVISDNLSYILAFRLLNGIGYEQLILVGYILLLVLFAIVFAFCYKRVVKYLIERWVVNPYVSYILVFLSVITVVFIYLNIIGIDQDNFYDSVRNNLAMFLNYLALLTISMFIVLYLSFQQYKMKQREQEMKNFESYVASLEQVNQDMRKFKHDYINILSTLRIYIDEKNYDGLHTYFYDHILETNYQEQLNQQAMMMLNNLKINSLKGLLTTKILQAQTHHVPFYIEIVEEITDIPVDPIIINRMLGILLDNATEAAREVENGEVRLAIIDMDESILLVINNIFDEKLNIKIHEIYQEGFSTKGENRGLGLANLRELKNGLHNVSLNTKISPPYFIQEIEFKKE